MFRCKHRLWQNTSSDWLAQNASAALSYMGRGRGATFVDLGPTNRRHDENGNRIPIESTPKNKGFGDGNRFPPHDSAREMTSLVVFLLSLIFTEGQVAGFTQDHVTVRSLHEVTSSHIFIELKSMTASTY